MAGRQAGSLLPRDDTGAKFLQLMSNPFASSIKQDSIIIAVFTALGSTALIFVAFILIRPFNSTVYAPRLRYADDKHKPPPLGKGLFAWYKPVFKHNESQYVETIGLDATVFLRFARMCRNMFIVLAIVGCAIIIPVNVVKGTIMQDAVASAGSGTANKNIVFLMTPQGLLGDVWWAFVAIAYVFDIIVCGFLWWNYRAIHRLRRAYMESPEYQSSLFSRTLMITDIPRNLRTDQGILEIADHVKTTQEVPRPSIGRNVKDIPDLIEQHEQAVIDLEQVLAKYLKNPNKLPPQRPLCKPSKQDPEYTNKEEKIDAITYLTARIERLETKIKEARQTVDKRDAMPYGFASYETINAAHSVAYAGRNKHWQGTIVQVAPRPNDLIWKNLPLDAKTRRGRRFVNTLWVTLLTGFYFIPNALIAVFLSDLSHLGLVWPAFQTELEKDSKFWAIVQGILAPALSSLFYYFLPIIFRRLSVNSGDLTKTSRERHVVHQLYSFFVFNNLLVFSLFAAAFQLVATIVSEAENGGKSVSQIWEDLAIFEAVMVALVGVSSYWVTWLVQRNLGAAIDLAQIVNLAWGSFSRKFLNPTPRELIKRTAPPPFEYASYYNYFLFYSTVALCFAALQPITLVVTAIYFMLDASMKKYLLLYVFNTKTESGGQFWRVLFNRFLVAAFLANGIIACLCGARGGANKWGMLAAMIPLPLLLIGFKFYCKRTFDDALKYYTKGDMTEAAEAPEPIDKESRRRDRVAVRFGNPSLYQKLTVPMVNKKSAHLLSELYRGRLDGDIGATAGYSDVYSMKRMSKETPGKEKGSAGPFEFVSENQMDFENFKNRSDFAEENGGNISRPGTPSTVFGGETVLGSERGRSQSRDSMRLPSETGVTYPAGYHTTPSALREYSPSPDRGLARLDSNQSTGFVRDETTLLGGAAPMGRDAPRRDWTPYSPERDASHDYFRPMR